MKRAWTKHRAARYAFIAVLSYLGLIAGLYLGQRHMQYFPTLLRPNVADTTVSEMTIVSVKTEDGLHNLAWLKLPEKPSEKTIVFLHGNALNIASRATKARHLLDAGLGVMLVEYRGFGGNPGYPSENGLYTDARAAIRYLLDEQHIPLDHIVIYGESLGTGVATKMAEEFPGAAALILEVPFDSALSIAQGRYPFIVGLDYLMHDQYRSDLRVTHLTMPKLFILAGKDRVLPVRHGLHLYDLAAEPKEKLLVPLAGHMNVYDYGAADRIIAFIQKQSATPPRKDIAP